MLWAEPARAWAPRGGAGGRADPASPLSLPPTRLGRGPRPRLLGPGWGPALAPSPEIAALGLPVTLPLWLLLLAQPPGAARPLGSPPTSRPQVPTRQSLSSFLPRLQPCVLTSLHRHERDPLASSPSPPPFPFSYSEGGGKPEVQKVKRFPRAGAKTRPPGGQGLSVCPDPCLLFRVRLTTLNW